MRRTDRIVYSVRNKINNKSYIGYCVSFKERKARHLLMAKKGKKSKFYNALRKYGPEAFEWIIMFDDLGTIEDCKQVEMKMIALFDTYENGYNGTIGGDGGNTFNGSNNSGVWKKGQTSMHKGRTFTKEHRQKLSEAHKGTPLSEKHTESLTRSKFKPVVQMDIEGNFIHEFGSLKEAGEFLGLCSVHIGACARGKHEHAYGFKWKYISKN